MRFVTFLDGGAPRAGVLDGDAVIDLADASMAAALAGVAPDMLAMIQAGLASVAAAIAAHGLRAAARRPLSRLRLLAPLRKPGRIVGVVHNYRDAIAERGATPPAAPMQFEKLASTLAGPGDPIVLPAGIGGVTYEAEIAAVIGTRAEAVAPDEALRHVAAYGVFNDISASALIRRDGRFDRGKNLPTFGPFGPCLATADEVPDPHALRIGLTNNGKALQDSSTGQMLFRVAELVSILSHQSALQPGDIIATGTPPGVAPTQDPPTWIMPGDTLTAWVEGLGSLTNPVIEGPEWHG